MKNKFFTYLYRTSIKMYIKVARAITLFVSFLMFLEIVGAAVTALPPASASTNTQHLQKAKSSTFNAFLFEKAEEETEKTEGGKGCMMRAVLLDFSQIADSLSCSPVPRVHLSSFTFQYDVRPSLHQLNGVFLI